MDANRIAIAKTCLDAAETGAHDLPGDRRDADAGGLRELRRRLPPLRRRLLLGRRRQRGIADPQARGPVAAAFDAAPIQGAIREAQQLAPGYTYMGFCRKVAAAGCAGYVVSFPGRRAVYMGRTGETHVETFPD
ncbi:MAG: hypothetical protein WDN45_11510 [Caulobacteraceae bacterium]